MPTIGQKVPFISTTPNAAQWNNAAVILNALRTVNIGTGLNGRFGAEGLTVAANAVGTTSIPTSAFPWGKEWICGLDTTFNASTSSTALLVYNYYPNDAVNNAELNPSFSEIIPLSTAPSFNDFNEDGRAILCIKNDNTLEFKTTWSNEDYQIYQPIYVLEALGTNSIIDYNIVLDIIHGTQDDRSPTGYTRLYRGSTTGTFSAGTWIYLGTPILEEDTNKILGYEISTSPGFLATTIGVFLEDLVDPYSSSVPPNLTNRERKDFVNASIGGAAYLSNGGDPYLVPASTTPGEWTILTEAELQTILDKITPGELEKFQKANIWKDIGDSGFAQKIDTLYGVNGAIELTTENVLRLKGSLPTTIGQDPIAYCYLGNGSYTWTEIQTTPTSATQYTGINSIMLTENNEFQLVGDDPEATGLYSNGGIWVDGSGSVTVGDSVSLVGDSSIPDVPNQSYIYSCTQGASGTIPGRAWSKVTAPGGCIALDTQGLRLSATTTSLPGSGHVYGFNHQNILGWVDCYPVSFSTTS